MAEPPDDETRLAPRRTIFLQWTPGHEAHILRHAVVPREVQEVCEGNPLSERGHQGRTVLIGPTKAGRMLTVVLDLLVGGAYLPVTARPASRKERARYRDRQGTNGDERPN